MANRRLLASYSHVTRYNMRVARGEGRAACLERSSQHFFSARLKTANSARDVGLSHLAARATLAISLQECSGNALIGHPVYEIARIAGFDVMYHLQRSNARYIEIDKSMQYNND